MALGIEIVEQPIRIITESDIWQIILAIATIAVAVSAWFTLLRGQQTTRSQLKLARDEFRHKTRPILARHVHKKRLRNVSIQHDGDVYTLTPQKVLFHFINNGTVTATNVRKQTDKAIHQYFDKPILDPTKESGVETERMSDLAPTEYYSVDIDWDIEYFDIAMKQRECYFALVIWYDDDEKNHYYYHMEGHFDRSMLMLDLVRTGILNENSQTK